MWLWNETGGLKAIPKIRCIHSDVVKHSQIRSISAIYQHSVLLLRCTQPALGLLVFLSIFRTILPKKTKNFGLSSTNWSVEKWSYFLCGRSSEGFQRDTHTSRSCSVIERETLCVPITTVAARTLRQNSHFCGILRNFAEILSWNVKLTWKCQISVKCQINVKISNQCKMSN